METNSNSSESLYNLNELVNYLSPLLNNHGWKYEAADDSHSSGGPFANGFFVNEKIKIGLIYRKSKLGSVNYEGRNTNLSHDEMFKALGKEAEKKLLYNENQFSSYAESGEGVSKALLLDLENVILPYIESTSGDDINSMMNAQPKWWEKANSATQNSGSSDTSAKFNFKRLFGFSK